MYTLLQQTRGFLIPSENFNFNFPLQLMQRDIHYSHNKTLPVYAYVIYTTIYNILLLLLYYYADYYIIVYIIAMLTAVNPKQTVKFGL